MRAVIVLNGEPCDFCFLSGDYIIACDGALEYLKKLSIEPHVILGDFDSLGYVPKNALKFPVEKDMTDGELALRYAAENGYKEVVFICGGGLREDHLLGNLALLQIADELKVTAMLETAYSTIRFVKNIAEFVVQTGATVSLVATEKTLVKSSQGLKYEYNNTTLETASTLGISNIATDSRIVIEFEYGGAYMLINKQRSQI